MPPIIGRVDGSAVHVPAKITAPLDADLNLLICSYHPCCRWASQPRFAPPLGLTGAPLPVLPPDSECRPLLEISKEMPCRPRTILFQQFPDILEGEGQ